MPIEQLAGLVDATTDVYALGASLLHLLTRREPWRLLRDTSFGGLNVGRPLRAFLTRLVAPEPKDRFPSAAAALAALELVAAGRWIDPPARAGSRPRPWLWAAPAAMVVMAAGAAVAYVALTADSTGPTEPTAAPPPDAMQVVAVPPPDAPVAYTVDALPAVAPRVDAAHVEPAPPPVFYSIDDTRVRADELYRAKRFAEAARLARDSAASSSDPELLRKLAAFYEQLGRAYSRGMSPATSATEAYAELIRAREIDELAGGAFRRELSAKLAIVAPRAAIAFLARRDYTEAQKALRTAEQLGSKSSDLELVRTRLREIEEEGPERF